MRALFGRHFWILRLFGVASASALAGSAASSALALLVVQGTIGVFDDAAVTDDAEVEELADEPEILANAIAGAAQPRARGAVGRQAAAASLSSYNPFCPTCRPAVDPAAPVMLAQGPGSPAVATVATRLPLRLHATMEAESAVDSLATIYDVERGIVGVYGQGDTLRPGVVVAAVTQGRVSLQTPNGAELLELGAPPPAPVAAEPKAKPDAEPKAATESPELDAITCSGADDCVVERAFVDEILANPAKFASQAPRVNPMPDGGFKVSGVRKGSLAKKLGLANGDVLLAVNGQELRGLDDALGLMTKLRRATNLEVSLDRKGKSVRKRIEIR
jgi:general secretion pathway protein C